MVMTIAATVGEALEFEGVDFRVLRAPDTEESQDDLRRAGVEPEERAKALLLKDAHGYVLTVTTATRILDMEVVRRELHRDLVPAEDDDLDELFCDCEAGSVPPIGPWYRIPTIVDSSLREQRRICFDAGEPRSLVQVTEQSFERLVDGADYFVFSQRTRT